MIELLKEKMVKAGGYHQSLKEFKFKGQKPVEQRLKSYGVDKIIRKYDRVLDIGCNCGFIDIYLSKEKKCHCVGIDIDKNWIDAALVAQEILKTDCKFICEDFKTWHEKERFDIVFALEAHMWIGMKFEDYIRKIKKQLFPGGYLIFETHNIATVDSDWQNKFNIIEQSFQKIKEGSSEDKDFYFKGVHSTGYIPRRWGIFKYA